MSLRTFLEFRPSGAGLWIAGGRTITSGQVINYADSIQHELEQFRGRRVAVRCERNQDLAVLLAVLDGVAEQILLLPRDIDEKSASGMSTAAVIDTLLTHGSAPASWDQLLALEGSAHCPISKSAAISTRWIIPTSGTSGTPKLVSHTFETLTRTVRTNRSVGMEMRWGLIYDLSRFAGIQVFLQALCGGAALIIPATGTDLVASLAEFVLGGCNALSATPSMWRRILMAENADRLDLKTVSLGGEIADQGVLNALRARFPGARITHIYASTEAGVGFSVKDGRSGFPMSYLDHPPAGTGIRVGSDGLLYLRPLVTGQDYVGSKERVADSEGWINTGDLVAVRGDRYEFLGRVNGAINVGGNKVQPQEIESIILGIEGVAFASARAKANAFVGSLVQVDVVPLPGVDLLALEREIERECDQKLEDFKRPAMIRFVDDIATGSSGKIQRNVNP